jgi:flagellar biosynthesis protein FliQ
MRVLLPAFVTSELKTAFQIGFIIFIPFLIIDMVVASVLMSMGMMMSPAIAPALQDHAVRAGGWLEPADRLPRAELRLTPAMTHHRHRPRPPGAGAHAAGVGAAFIAALVTGLIISIFQAATQINEQTLSFVPS